ncbi:MAG: AraC family transcriptional regulator [Bacteroidia bacterium]
MTASNHLPAKITHRERDNETNRLVYSRYQHFEAEAICDAYSLKYVTKGEEVYLIEGRREVVRPEQFLLVNCGQELSINIHDQEPVEGLCVFLSQDLMDEVHSAFHSKDEQLLDRPAARNARFPGSFSSRYLGEQSRLGAYLHQVAQQQRIEQAEAFIEDKASLYQLAELLCQQQQLVETQIGRLQSRKRSTREELFRRLTVAMEYMHDNWHVPPKMPEVAREAALSEYHFYRLFRKAFAQSPQQYLLAFRLDKSLELLSKPHYSITEVADACGFYDVHHFNKAFRKHFGEKPSGMRGFAMPKIGC